jgi:hypothetical protein
MLRGTRTQYLRRLQYFFLWFGFFSWFCILSVPVVLSTGWERIFWLCVSVPMYILSLLLGITRLTDKRWYRWIAEAERKANQRRGPIYFPSTVTERALAFAKRIFGGDKSD